MANRHRGSPAERRALAAYVKLHRAADAVWDRVHGHLAEHGLTVSQFGALEALYHLGPLCQRDIGAKILKSGGNVTFVLDNLERRGLVARRRDAANRRFVNVELTAAGAELIAGIFPRHAREVARAMAVLSPAEQRQLAGLCKRLGLAQGEG